MRKFKMVNGRVVEDRDMVGAGAAKKSTVSAEALVPVYTLSDIQAVGVVTGLPVPNNIQSAYDAMDRPDYMAGFGVSSSVVPGGLFAGLEAIFQQNEIPIGLMDKLIPLQEYALHFKIDDSGSMVSDSNLSRSEAPSYMQNVGDARKSMMNRWQEAEDRLHTLVDVLCFVPTGPITLSFLNDQDRITLDRTGKSPEEFAADAHQIISAIFREKQPAGRTPIYSSMCGMLDEAQRSSGKTMHYLLTDGEPDGGAEDIRRIKDLLVRRDANRNPFTFLGCSNNREDHRWMHEVEEIAPLVASLPDYRDERIEVLNDQGPGFPYSRGFWLLCNLVAAINPNDLDAMDQHEPLTKTTIENLLGRGITGEEYRRYWNAHPNARRVFEPDYQAFLEVPYARMIPSVALFQRTLANLLSRDMDRGEDDTDDLEERMAEETVMRARRNGELSQSRVSQAGMWSQPQSNNAALPEVSELKKYYLKAAGFFNASSSIFDGRSAAGVVMKLQERAFNKPGGASEKTLNAFGL